MPPSPFVLFKESKEEQQLNYDNDAYYNDMFLAQKGRMIILYREASDSFSFPHCFNAFSLLRKVRQKEMRHEGKCWRFS